MFHDAAGDRAARLVHDQPGLHRLETLKALPVVGNELSAKAQRDFTIGVDHGIECQARAALAALLVWAWEPLAEGPEAFDLPFMRLPPPV